MQPANAKETCIADIQADEEMESSREPSVAEKLVRDGIEVADPSGAQSVLTPTDAQVAQAKAMAGGKVTFSPIFTSADTDAIPAKVPTFWAFLREIPEAATTQPANIVPLRR